MNKVHAPRVQAYRQHDRIAPSYNRAPSYGLRRFFVAAAAVAACVGIPVGINALTEVDVQCSGTTDYLIEPGDDFLTIAKSVEQSGKVGNYAIVHEIESINPGVRSGSLAVGQHINVPETCSAN